MLRLLQERRQAMSDPVILSFLYELIRRVEMPYPKEVLDQVLGLFKSLIPSFKSTVDNQMKGYFLEFLESCLQLKEEGKVDVQLLDSIISSVSNVQYICLSVCLKGCQ